MAQTPLSQRRYSTESTQSHISIPSPSTPASERHQCSQCPSSFLRLEHLKRHERDHWDSKPYTCSLCGKGFTRSDTLKRHEHVHAAVSSDGENGPSSVSTRSHRGRHFRACHNCAQARARCSGEDVCSRCLSKALMCEYPKKRRRSLQSSPTRNAFAAQDPAWSIGELTLHTNTNSPTGSHVMIDNDNLSCYSSSSETFPHHHMSSYNLSSHDLSNLSPLEINYEQLSPLVDPDNGGLISPDIDTFDLGQPFPPQPPPQPHHHHQLTMGMGSVMPPNHADVTQPINWLPTAFSEEIDYAALSGVGVPLRNPNNNRIEQANFQDQLSGMDFAATAQATAAQQQQQQQQQQHQHSSLQPPQPHSPPPPHGRRNSSHSPARSTGGSSNSSAESSGNNSGGGPGTSSGRYYTTSFDGARIPFVRGTKRRRSFNVQSPAPDHNPHTRAPSARSSLFRDQSGVYQFPEICVPIDSLPPVAVTGPAMDLKAYDRIADAFRQVCHGLGTTFVPFKTLAVPGPAHLNYFLQLYYEHFHPILPMLHLPTLRLGEDEWVLGLAAAAIGCRYADSEELLGFSRPMTEFLRRVVVMSVEHHPPRQMPLGVLQALLLNSINLLYSGSSRFADSALNDFSRLVEAVRTWKLLPSSETPPQSWSEWVRAEARIRLGYSIWLLDCTMAYQMDQKPFLTLDDLHSALPCNEHLWAAQNEEHWAHLRRNIERNPPISEAVHTLFVRKEVKPDLGEFSRVLLLHGIYHEMWTVARYQRRSLASWVPSASATDDGSNHDSRTTPLEFYQERPQNVADRSIYMPENALYSKWRNAACDCLDVLHWAANATIAQHSGSEHNTVCHLHASRVILLTPLSEIVSLAKSIAAAPNTSASTAPSALQSAHSPGDPNRQSLPQLTKLESKISLWVSKDAHKARLAMIHAGAVFWHVRRFSKAAFYEPHAVFLSTLAMWAYASYTSLTHAFARTDSRSGSDSPSPGGETVFTCSDDFGSTSAPPPPPDSAMGMGGMPGDMQEDWDPDHPTFIRLDRPNDDEMVQLFVRNGDPARMKAHVSGVGNLLSPLGPERVLREGCKILSRMTLTWGVASEHVKVLSSMIEVASSVRSQGSVSSVQGPPS